MPSTDVPQEGTPQLPQASVVEYMCERRRAVGRRTIKSVRNTYHWDFNSIFGNKTSSSGLFDNKSTTNTFEGSNAIGNMAVNNEGTQMKFEVRFENSR